MAFKQGEWLGGGLDGAGAQQEAAQSAAGASSDESRFSKVHVPVTASASQGRR